MLGAQQPGESQHAPARAAQALWKYRLRNSQLINPMPRIAGQDLYLCRKPERTFNSCVFDKLQLKKDIPGAPQGQPQIHEKQKPIWKGMQH